MDFAQWAARRGLDIIKLHPPVLLEISKLSLEDNVTSQTIDYHRPVLERPQVLAIVEGATIRDSDGLVRLPTVEICYEGNWWIKSLKIKKSTLRLYSE